ncbi:MAG: taurine ABC transporter permease [Candidatus Tectimicrobiota bacterium]|nr:MAG: taurine ABC transporter permease [Candidatus Tectomicrobia bacterium]
MHATPVLRRALGLGVLKRWASVIALFALWEGVCRARLVDPFLLPALSEVLRRGAGELWSGELVAFTALTLYRTLAAFVLAGAIGIAIGVSMSLSAPLRWFGEPVVSFAFPIPKIALMPIFVLWFGVFDLSKIVMTTVAAVVTVISATHLGTRHIDKYLLWSAQSLGTHRRALFWKIVIPAALPAILTGLQIALPMCLIVSIVTEMITGGRGLGGYMIYASRFAESDKVFLGIFLTALIGYVLTEGLAMARRRLLAWHPEETVMV